MKALLNTKEAAEYIGFPEQALRLSRSTKGSLSGHKSPPFVKVGEKSVRYKLTDLDEWIDGLGQ